MACAWILCLMLSSGQFAYSLGGKRLWWRHFKRLPLAPRSVIGCARHINLDPIMWNTQSDQSVELPPRLLARNRPPGAQPGTGSRCVRAQTVCSTWELHWGLLLWSGGATSTCRRSSPWAQAPTPPKEFALSDVTGLLRGWFSWKCFYSQPTVSRGCCQFEDCFGENASHLLPVPYPNINAKTKNQRCASECSAWCSRLNLEVLIMNYGDSWLQNSVDRELQAFFGNLPPQLSLITLGLTLPWNRLCWLRAVEASQIFMVQLFACYYGTVVCKVYHSILLF